MDSVTPEHSMVWFEIPVTDMERSKAFYATVLRTSFHDDNTGPNPMAIFATKNMESGLSRHLYPGKPAAEGNGNTIHLAAPEPLEEALQRVGESGGRVLSPILKIPPGRFAYCLDPDGNSIGLFTKG
ncbi:MAG: VOC family protein [Rhizobiales bacterium]|nr:VOC family protein [Hyphomicrobiales bacterium]